MYEPEPDVDPMLFLPFLLIALVIVLIVWLREVVARRTPAPSTAHTVGAPETNGPLTRRATAALVELDDAVHSAQEDVAAARAEFGTAATEPFRLTVVNIRTRVEDAYHVLHELEQEHKDGTVFPGVERSRLKGILTLTKSAGAQLTALDRELTDLRGLHARLGEFLVSLRARTRVTHSRVPAARAALAELAEVHSGAALLPLTGGLAQGTRLVDAAQELIDQADVAATADESTRAVSAARAAETALGQADVLLSGVITGQEVLEEAGVDLVDALASIREDIAEAHEMDTLDEITAHALEEAEGALEHGVSARDGGDVIRALTTLEHAEHRLDDALEPYREDSRRAAVETRVAQSRARRRERMITRRFRTARRRIEELERLVKTHRGSLDGTPRKDLQEARRTMKRAEQHEDDAGTAELLSEAEEHIDRVDSEVIVALGLDKEPMTSAEKSALVLAVTIGGIAIGGLGGLAGLAAAGGGGDGGQSSGGFGGGGRF